MRHWFAQQPRPVPARFWVRRQSRSRQASVVARNHATRTKLVPSPLRKKSFAILANQRQRITNLQVRKGGTRIRKCRQRAKLRGSFDQTHTRGRRFESCPTIPGSCVNSLLLANPSN